MIYLNGNTYKTLDQKFYHGGTQIGKVYHGDTLVYPEIVKENVVVTDEGNILEEDIPSINGNVYDTGIAASNTLGVELIFNTNFTTTTDEFRAFFGTHDNRTSYATNRDYYGSNCRFHFIINKNYKISVRINGTSEYTLTPSLTADEKSKKLFWVSFRNNQFKFGTGGKIGENIKAQTSYSITSFSGANLWINGHNQGVASPNTPIREWIGGNFGLQIPETKFHYVKVFKSDTDYYTFSFENCNASDLYPNSNVQAYVKIIKRHYNNGSISDTETIYPFTYIEPNT